MFTHFHVVTTVSIARFPTWPCAPPAGWGLRPGTRGTRSSRRRSSPLSTSTWCAPRSRWALNP